MIMIFNKETKLIISTSFLGEKKREIEYVLMNILDGFSDDGPCLQPCKKMKFDSRLTKFNDRKDKVGLFIQLEEKITVQNNHFLIDEMTLMTRIGGIIGVGKELLWVFIILISFATFITKICIVNT